MLPESFPSYLQIGVASETNNANRATDLLEGLCTLTTITQLWLLVQRKLEQYPPPVQERIRTGA